MRECISGDGGGGGGGARRHVLISHPFTVQRMKHDRNHRRKCGPSYTPMMITRDPQKKHGLHIHGVSFLVFLFFPPPFFLFSFFPPWKITNNENVRAHSTVKLRRIRNETLFPTNRYEWNICIVYIFFLFNLSLSLFFSFLSFNLICLSCNISVG